MLLLLSTCLLISSTAMAWEWGASQEQSIPYESEVDELYSNNDYDSEYKIPDFISEPEKVMVYEGDTLKLPCFVDRLQGFVLLWKKNSDLVTVGSQIIDKADTRIKLEEEQNGNYLVISLTKESDAGEYVCQISAFKPTELKHSVQIIGSTNFTTKPNPPGPIGVLFRNETTLMVLCQSPSPAGIYSDYKVTIEPKDANVSETYVPKDGDPPAPAYVAFNGLFPGRAYNISVQTVSEGQISDPTTAQYRTVPLRPLNVTFDREIIGPNFFSVKWLEPRGLSEFDKYQVSLIQAGLKITSKTVLKGQSLVAEFTENIQPGTTYGVAVKTVSGPVASLPATGTVTTRPLPVRNLTLDMDRRKRKIIFAFPTRPHE